MAENSTSPATDATPNLENKAPSNVATVGSARRPRKPMSTAQRKLEIPDIDGWRLYWFRPDNISAAIEAGYEFVKDYEVSLNRNNISAEANLSGNTDLGTNVSIVGGKTDTGQPERLTLMKIKQEWFQEDQAALLARNVGVMEAIFDKEEILGPGGQISPKGQLTYLGERTTKPLMNRPTRKAKIGRGK